MSLAIKASKILLWLRLHFGFCATAALLPIICEQVKTGIIIIYTDYYKSYNVFDVSEFSHFRINHSIRPLQNPSSN